MDRFENGSYDEIVAHFEMELEFTAIEGWDDLPMATMNSSTSKPKSLFSKGLLNDTVCNSCKKRVIWSKTARNLKKEKGAQKGKPNQKTPSPSVGHVAIQTTLRNDVGKVQVHISSLNVLSAKTHCIAIRNQKHRKLTITPYRPAPSPHRKRTIQKNNFATTQHIHLVSVRPYVSSHSPTKGFHEYQQQLMEYPSVAWQQQLESATLKTQINTLLYQNQFLFGTVIAPQTSPSDSGPFHN